jgi:hypothetical protein
MIEITIAGEEPADLLAQIGHLGAAASAFEAAAVQWLRDRDYAVSKNGRWETPQALAARLRVSVKHICRRRKHPRCPEHGVEFAPGSAQLRVQAISSNPAFEDFLLANKNTTKHP